MGKIVCCGEALIDMIPTVGADGQAAFAPHAGGAVHNTAIALGRLGADVGFFTGLSCDMFGDMLRDSLTGAGVDISACVTCDRPTTLAFVQLTNGQARYAFFDENSAGRMITQNDTPNVQADCLFFGGISLVAEPGADALLQMAQETKARVMLDPNIRPGVINNITRYRTRLNAMLAVVDIVKVSDEDLMWITGSDAPLLEQAARLRASGPEVVIVTQGSDGAMALCGDETLYCPAEQAQIVDTVGAGDTFNAGVLASLQGQGALRGDITLTAVQQALQLGAKAAAVTVARAGANPPWASEL